MTESRIRGLRGPAAVVTVLVFAVVFIQLIWCVQIWQANHTVVETHSWGTTASHGGIDRMPFVYSTLGWLAAVLAAGTVLLVWLWRARTNSAILGTAEHRLGRGWTIGSWFTPVLSLVLPAIVVEDIVRASDPASPAGGTSLKGVPHSGLVWTWWIVWALAWASVVVERSAFMSTNDSYSDIDEAADAWTRWAATYTGMTLLFGISAALLVTILARVGGWQAGRS
jgi:hypothetical protein